jgi:ribosome-binding ATPase YchF (GTP1/OBG family)
MEDMIVGVVGKANVGKSTFFKAATLAEVEIANYPFVTIKPNSGVGYVKVDCVDKEFNVQCNPREGFCLDHKRFVPVQMIDVAGLVPGAHMGKGMGNQFLDDLRQADVLIHVVDVAGTTNEKGEPIQPGSYDPANDVKFLEVEIDMWYKGILAKGWERFARQVVQEKKEIQKALAKQLSGFKVTEEMLNDTIGKLGLDKSKPDKWKDKAYDNRLQQDRRAWR